MNRFHVERRSRVRPQWVAITPEPGVRFAQALVIRNEAQDGLRHARLGVEYRVVPAPAQDFDARPIPQHWRR